MDTDDKRDEQTYAIIGAAMEVHRRLGPGFVEPVYQEAFAVELTARHIPFQPEVRYRVVYRNQPLDCLYKADFVCYDQVLVETKALERLTKVEHAQVINYKRFVYTVSMPETSP